MRRTRIRLPPMATMRDSERRDGESLREGRGAARILYDPQGDADTNHRFDLVDGSDASGIELERAKPTHKK